MAYLWVKGAAGDWSTLSAVGDRFDLLAISREAHMATQVPDNHAKVILFRGRQLKKETWLLVVEVNLGICVNGQPLLLGMRVLADKDELRVPGLPTIFFTTESLARVEVFPGGEQQIACPRCKQGIEKGVSTVQCPRCHVWHHQADQLPCWVYSSTCALCDQPTDLRAGFLWTPEGL